MSFYTELKRRNVIRVGVAYAVFAWLLVQVAATTFPLFGFDETPSRIVVIVLVIGFVPALVFAWAFELTPAGIERDEDVDRTLTITTGAAKRLDRIIMFVLVVAVGFFAIDKFIFSESRERAIVESARIAAFAEAVEVYKTNRSIAVLPFVDLSANEDYEYFGDGLAEELLDKLVRLEGLNVASRTSSFAYKGKTADISTIGKELGVTSVLEGSVRRDADDLRVTAQLIDAQHDRHIWSATFDRKLTDIFFLQQEIAEEVAAALSIALDIEGRNHLPGAGTTDIAAYETYLAGRAWARIAQPAQAQPYFEIATAKDPGYADAWAQLAASIALQSDNHPTEVGQEMQVQARDLLLRAVQIDPELAPAWRSLGSLNRVLGNWPAAVEATEKSAALTPGDINAQMNRSGVFGALGHTREAIVIRELAQEVQPMKYGGAQTLAEYYIQARRYDDARATLEISESISPVVKPGVIKRRFFIALAEQDLDAAGKLLAEYAEVRPEAEPMIERVLSKLGSSSDDVLDALRGFYAEGNEMPGQGRVIMASLASFFGDPEFAMVVMRDELDRGLFRLRRVWYPFLSDMRKTQGFKDLLVDLELDDFYRRYGWPDYCRPLGDDDFECS